MKDLSIAHKYFYFILTPEKGRSTKSFLNYNHGIVKTLLFEMLMNDTIYFEHDAFFANEEKVQANPFYKELMEIANQPSKKSLVSVGQMDNLTEKSDVVARMLAVDLEHKGLVKIEEKKSFFGRLKKIIIPTDSKAQSSMFSPMADKINRGGEFTEEEIEMLYLIFDHGNFSMLKKYHHVDITDEKLEQLMAGLQISVELQYAMNVMDKVGVDYVNSMFG